MEAEGGWTIPFISSHLTRKNRIENKFKRELDSQFV